MLDTKERERLIEALKIWASNAPQTGAFGFLRLADYSTRGQVLSEVQERTEDGQAMLEILEHAVRREGIDRVTARLMNHLDERRRN
jgi:hypothetical protein